MPRPNYLNFYTAYNAVYLDLALRINAVLATFDIQLANAMRSAGGTVFGDIPWPGNAHPG